MRYYVEDLAKYVGQKIELKGWAYQTRSSGKVKFLELRDGTGIVPCIFFQHGQFEFVVVCFIA